MIFEMEEIDELTKATPLHRATFQGCGILMTATTSPREEVVSESGE